MPAPSDSLEPLELPWAKSTNDEAFLRLDSGESCAVWTLDQRQGRGSRGRQWLTPAGRGLALSIGMLAREIPHPGAFSYPLFAAVLLHRALTSAGVEAGIALKWPNDVLWRGRKLAGILCESRWSGNQVKVVIGIGLNLFPCPELENLPKPTASLSEVLADPQPRHLVANIAGLLPKLLADYGQSTDKLCADWLSLAWIDLGTLVRCSNDGQQWSGRFTGLGPGGELNLRLDDGETIAIHQNCENIELIPI